jgi:hypothetical protein
LGFLEKKHFAWGLVFGFFGFFFSFLVFGILVSFVHTCQQFKLAIAGCRQTAKFASSQFALKSGICLAVIRFPCYYRGCR